MIYMENIAFAMRTINLYNAAVKNNVEFRHTLSLGALLNVFSVIVPDQEFIIDTGGLKEIGLPHLVNPTKDEIEEYLKILRNALAHKTASNFKNVINPGTNQMMEIELSSRMAKNPIRLNLMDLENIIKSIDLAMSQQYKEIYRMESKMFR